MISSENSEGLAGKVLVFSLLILIGLVIAFSVYGPNSNVKFVKNLPSGIGFVYDTLNSIFKPIIDIVYLAVAPANSGENTQAIAVSVFLLLTIVGFKTLGTLFDNKFISLVVSSIIGVIAGRSLTETVLRDSALGASPLAAVSLLLGLLPILALSKGFEKLDIKSDFSKLGIYVLAAGVYFIFFSQIFAAYQLGIMYAVGILFIGAAEIWMSYFNSRKIHKRNEALGSTLNKMDTMLAQLEDVTNSTNDAKKKAE